jgi:pimeloyl-ACP methyl ester carboxylesterase
MATYRSDVTDAAPPDPATAAPAGEPQGFVVVVEPGDRIHFLDWGGPAVADAPGVVLVHGLSASAWVWAPVARRLIAVRRTVAMDLRGHGLSDAPTDAGAYDLAVLAEDVVAVAEGSGLLDDAPTVTLAGHGFGAIVAAAAAAELGDRCARLALIDGGLDHLPTTTGLEVDEFLRGLDEPPEVMRSMAAWLADRRDWDPATWDADQERAARAAVVATPAGRLVSATRPHALEAAVRAMFGYRPDAALAGVTAPVVAIRRITPGDETAVEPGDPAPSPAAPGGLTVVDVPAPGHNLIRYRPDEVTAAILGR